MLMKVAEQVDTMRANPEDQDSMQEDMLSTLIKHLI